MGKFLCGFILGKVSSLFFFAYIACIIMILLKKNIDIIFVPDTGLPDKVVSQGFPIGLFISGCSFLKKDCSGLCKEYMDIVAAVHKFSGQIFSYGSQDVFAA